MKRTIYVANEQLAPIPPTRILKFLLYCSIVIMGLAFPLFLFAALRATTASSLVLALASGVFVCLMCFCLNSLYELRKYAYLLAYEKITKYAAFNRPLAHLPTTRTLTVVLWIQSLGAASILLYLGLILMPEVTETVRMRNPLLWLVLNATWLFLVIRGLDSLENVRNFALNLLAEQPEGQIVVNANEDKLCDKASLIMLLFPRRIGRCSYFIRYCALGLLLWGIVGSGFVEKSRVTGSILLLLCSIYHLLWVVLPRMHDLRMRTSWLVLTLVPIINGVFGLILLFRARRPF